MTVKAYQRHIARELRTVIPEAHTLCEWEAFGRRRQHYSPRLDIAVGPFAVGDLHRSSEYAPLLQRHQALVASLYECFIQNLASLDERHDAPSLRDVRTANKNARCLLGIEVENRGARKHMMGSAVNAAALGQIGVVVGWTERAVMSLVGIRRYLLFLASVGKPTFAVANLMILGADQFADIVFAPREC